MHRVGKIHAPQAIARSGETDDTRPVVLFVCVHNAGRSRMAAAFLDRLAGDRYAARSAGTQPAARPHPEVVSSMEAEGLLIDDGPGTLLTEEMLASAAAVVSMGCDIADACPGAAVETDDWELDDPAGKTPEQVADIRDQIEMKVRNLVARLDRAAAD